MKKDTQNLFLFLIILVLGLLVSCTDGTYTPEEPQPLVSTGLQYILPNTVWKERMGQPDAVFRWQFRDNMPADTTRTVCTMDQHETEFSCSGEWLLRGDTGIYIYWRDLTGFVTDTMLFRVDGYSYDTLTVTPVLPGGSGTPRKWERE